MKMWSFTIAFVSIGILTSCSKDASLTNNNPDTNSPSTRITAAAPGVVTSWESGYTWNTSDSSDYKLFSFSRATSELSADVISHGAVLVFVKNYNDVDGQRNARPMLTPFHVLPTIGRPGYDQKWYTQLRVGNIDIKYRTNKHKYGGPAQIPDAAVQFRYFVLPQSELSKFGHTQQSILQLSYGELVQLLGSGE